MSGGGAQLVFIPTPGVGHLVSAVEIAKLLIGRDAGISVTVLIMNLTDNSALKAIVDSVSASSTSERISFIELPPGDFRIQPGSGSFKSFLKAIESHKPHVKDAALGLADSPKRLAGFVIDMFCASMIDVANELGVPTYVFFTSSATFLGHMFHLQELKDEQHLDITRLVESDATIDYPGFANPLPAKFLPFELMTSKETSDSFLDLAKRFRETKGIVVNSFEELEPRVMESVFDDKLPPVYSLGPILNLKGGSGAADILEWLDDQPPASVVFLCFGSKGSLSENQLRLIARGLEKSGYRFLWSLRRPPLAGKYDFPTTYENPEEVLPEGFLDRTAGRGKVIGWAPQVEVLAHPAVGGFVSHCGWNSTLESIWFGVPMAAWPLAAEQHFNAFALVVELGMAVEVRMDFRRDYVNGNEITVTPEEIETAIRRLMTETGSDGRKAKVKLMSEKSRRAVTEGGSSYVNLGRFIQDVYRNMS